MGTILEQKTEADEAGGVITLRLTACCGGS